MQLSGKIQYMDRLNLADAFVTFFALLGPQKVLLSITRMARAREVIASGSWPGTR